MYLTQSQFGGSQSNFGRRNFSVDTGLNSIPEDTGYSDFPNPEQPYPNKWKEWKNLSRLHLQITNRNRVAKDSFVTTNIKNQKYLEVVKSFIKPDFIWKTLKWVDNLDEDNKRVSHLFSLTINFRVLDL